MIFIERYPKSKHGGELWAKLETQVQVIPPLFVNNQNRGGK